MRNADDRFAALRKIGLDLQNCPGDVDALAKLARELVEVTTEIQVEKRRSAARARQEKVMAVNVAAGRVILPTYEYADLASQYDA